MTTLTPKTLAELRRRLDGRADMAEICYACDVMWALPALLDAAEERDRLEGEIGTTLNRLQAAHEELSALRATIAAGEPFDADEIEAMQIAGLKGELAAARRATSYLWVRASLYEQYSTGYPPEHASAIARAVEEDRARVAKVGR